MRGPAATEAMMLAGAEEIAPRAQPPSKDNVQQIFLLTMFIKENISKKQSSKYHPTHIYKGKEIPGQLKIGG